MSLATATVNDAATGQILAFGTYNIKYITITNNDSTASVVTFFDCDDTDKAIVHAATTTVATSQVDRYAAFARSTTDGEQGRPYLPTGDAGVTSIDNPPTSAPSAPDADDVARAYDVTTTTGTTQSNKYTGKISTATTVTANSATVSSFLSISVAAGDTVTYPSTNTAYPCNITLVRGLAATSTGGDVSITVSY